MEAVQTLVGARRSRRGCEIDGLQRPPRRVRFRSREGVSLVQKSFCNGHHHGATPASSDLGALDCVWPSLFAQHNTHRQRHGQGHAVIKGEGARLARAGGAQEGRKGPRRRGEGARRPLWQRRNGEECQARGRGPQPRVARRAALDEDAAAACRRDCRAVRLHPRLWRRPWRRRVPSKGEGA